MIFLDFFDFDQQKHCFLQFFVISVLYSISVTLSYFP